MKTAPMERRKFLRTVVTVFGIVAAGCASSAARGRRTMSGNDSGHDEAEVTPGEDLMQEHGILERILMIYDEAALRIERRGKNDLTVITSAAGIVRHFIEDYHEKLEEEFVFPRLREQRREVDLVAVLLRQHERGREVTDEIARRAKASGGSELASMLRSFVRMYRPHAAREDTVLFPAFRDVVGRAAYRELGEQFEEEEHKRFGKNGFRDTVVEVARLETTLGIADLASFTA